MTYSYTYTVTTYSYNCQVCGTRSGGVPRESEIPRCAICDIALCKHCFQHGLCPAHWNQVPPDIQQRLVGIHRKVERRKKLGFLFFFIFIACSLGVIIGEGSAGRIQIALPVGFSLMFLAVISIIPAASPVKRLLKKVKNIIAPYIAQNGGMSGMVKPNVNSQNTTPQPQTGPTATQKFCSYCGALINKDAVFCEKCGAKLSNP